MSVISTLLVAIGVDPSGVGKGVDEADGKLAKFAGGVGRVGAGLTAGVTLPLVAVGAAALKSAMTVDEAYDTIQAGTGATGKELQGLQDSFGAVAAKTPSDMNAVAESITMLNQRLGLTGPTLEKLSQQVLEAGRLGGVEVDIKNVTSAFSAFDVKGKQTTAGMDTLFQVSQATGVGINDLSAIMAKQGGVLSQLGFSFKDSAALIGVMDKAGVNSRAVTSAMSAGLVKLAKDGEAPADAFKRVGSQIQGFVDRGKDAEALNLAAKVFGTRGAGQFVAALKSGKVNLDDISKSAGLSGQSILGVAEKTKDFPEMWAQFKNQATLALAPIAADLMPKISAAVLMLSGKLTALIAWWDGLSGTTQKFILVAAGVVAAIGPLLMIVSKVITIFGVLGKVISAFRTVWVLLNVAFAMSPIGVIIVGVVALVAALVLAYQHSETFRNIVNAAFGAVRDVVMAVVEWFKTAVPAAWEWVRSVTETAFNAVKDVVVGVWDGIKSAVSTTVNAVKSVVSTVFAAIATVVTTYVDIWKTVITTAWTVIRTVVTAVVGAVKSVIEAQFNAAKAVVTGVMDAIRSVVSSVWDAVKSKVSAAVGSVRDAISTAWSAVREGTERVWSGLKEIVSRAISGVMTVVNGIKGKITGVFDGAAGWLLGAGKAVLQGLIDGIEAMIDVVKSKLNSVTEMIPDWKGPATTDRKLLQPAGKMIMEGLIRGFEGELSDVKATLEKVTTLIEQTMSKRFKNDKIAAAMTQAAMAGIRNESQALLANARARERVAEQLDAARDKLADAIQQSRDYAASVRDSIVAFGNITQFIDAEAGTTSAASIVEGLRTKLAAARDYAKAMRELVSLGLNETMLQQIEDAGVDGGLATAQALVDGGPLAIAEVNALSNDLATVGGNLGTKLADTMYGAGIDAAQALVDSLESKAAALEQTGRNLAQQFMAALRTELGAQGAGRFGLDVDGVYTRATAQQPKPGNGTGGTGRPGDDALLAATRAQTETIEKLVLAVKDQPRQQQTISRQNGGR